jgi:hypothetical protein
MKDGQRVISVSDPAHPVEVGYRDSLGAAIGVVANGDRAYVASWLTAWRDGLRVISVADPAHPVEVGYYSLSNAGSVALSGDYACVAHWSGLKTLQFYGEGVEETPSTVARVPTPMSTIVRGVRFRTTESAVAANLQSTI